MMKWIGVAALAAFILIFGGHFGTCLITKAHAATQAPHTQAATDLSARRHYITEVPTTTPVPIIAVPDRSSRSCRSSGLAMARGDRLRR
jgi:archaellin